VEVIIATVQKAIKEYYAVNVQDMLITHFMPDQGNMDAQNVIV
jgi:hypothetical protein